jgi:hypothetical protein
MHQFSLSNARAAPAAGFEGRSRSATAAAATVFAAAAASGKRAPFAHCRCMRLEGSHHWQQEDDAHDSRLSAGALACSSGRERASSGPSPRRRLPPVSASAGKSAGGAEADDGADSDADGGGGGADADAAGRPLRVERLLANLGYGKRQECAALVKRGRVTFAANGKAAKVLFWARGLLI